MFVGKLRAIIFERQQQGRQLRIVLFWSTSDFCQIMHQLRKGTIRCSFPFSCGPIPDMFTRTWAIPECYPDDSPCLQVYPNTCDFSRYANWLSDLGVCRLCQRDSELLTTVCCHVHVAVVLDLYITNLSFEAFFWAGEFQSVVWQLKSMSPTLRRCASERWRCLKYYSGGRGSISPSCSTLEIVKRGVTERVAAGAEAGHQTRAAARRKDHKTCLWPRCTSGSTRCQRSSAELDACPKRTVRGV